MKPKDLLEALVQDIHQAENPNGHRDFEELYVDDQERIKATALHLMLEGWTKP